MRISFLCTPLSTVFWVTGLMFWGACSNPDPETRIPAHYRLQAGENPLTFQQQLYYLAAALEIYRLHTGAYPSEENNLDALIAKPEILEGTGVWYGPYAESDDFFYDPWQRRIQYTRTEGKTYELQSLGADGVVSNDDISARELMPDLYREMEKLAAFGPLEPAASTPANERP